MTSQLENEPKLGKPGGGLPPHEWFVAKYILLPKLFKNTDKEKAKQIFKSETKKILELAKQLDEEQLAKRCLIERIRGLEDNSRYYSVAMVLDHLTKVGHRVIKVLTDLTTTGSTDTPKVGIEGVKPSPDVEPKKAIEAFESMTEEFVEKAFPLNLDAYPDATFDHPWFGPTNAAKWFIFTGTHQGVHRRQIESIIEILGTE